MKSDPLRNEENGRPPGVPGFKTWRGLYAFVFAFFLFVVAALALFSRVFS